MLDCPELRKWSMLKVFPAPNPPHQLSHLHRLARLFATMGLRIETPGAAQRTTLHPHHTTPPGTVGPAAGKKSMKTQGHF
jgi:hypothetical protein